MVADGYISAVSGALMNTPLSELSDTPLFQPLAAGLALSPPVIADCAAAYLQRSRSGQRRQWCTMR